MSNYWDMNKKRTKKAKKEWGVDCAECKQRLPKATPPSLLPGQKCKIDGHRDTRKCLKRSVIYN